MYTTRGFLKAAMRGKTDVIERYFARDGAAAWIGVKDGSGSNALHHAIDAGQADVVKLLLKNGADVEAMDGQNMTPLAKAVVNVQHVVMKSLIEAGADVNAPAGSWTSLLCLAASGYAPESVEILLQAKADPNKGKPLIRALDRNSFDTAARLIAAGADPNVSGSGAMRPLHHAAMRGAEELMQVLLEHDGIEIDAQDSQGMTPLHYAVIQGNAGCVDMLLKKGARADIENSRGVDAYKAAIDRGNTQIIRRIEPLVKEAVAKNTTALTASADALPEQDAEVWVRMGAHQVARVGVYPALGRRLTEVFNFESRERLIISENLKTGAENVTQPVAFEAVNEGLLKKAFASFRSLGGDADEDEVFGGRALKKAPALKP